MLIGDIGLDNLTGGSGADRFKFNAIAESGASSTTGDVIVDFSQSQGDRIDLSAIDADTTVDGNQKFHFDAATGPATGHVGFYRETVSGKTYVFVNNDGDADVDMVIVLNGVVDLTAGDFVL